MASLHQVVILHYNENHIIPHHSRKSSEGHPRSQYDHSLPRMGISSKESVSTMAPLKSVIQLSLVLPKALPNLIPAILAAVNQAKAIPLAQHLPLPAQHLPPLEDKPTKAKASHMDTQMETNSATHMAKIHSGTGPDWYDSVQKKYAEDKPTKAKASHMDTQMETNSATHMAKVHRGTGADWYYLVQKKYAEWK